MAAEEQVCRECGSKFECVFDEANTELCLNCSFKEFAIASTPIEEKKEQGEKKEKQEIQEEVKGKKLETDVKDKGPVAYKICGDLLFYPLYDANGQGWAELCDALATFHSDAVKYIISKHPLSPSFDTVDLGVFQLLDLPSDKALNGHIHPDCQQHLQMQNLPIDWMNEPWLVVFQRLQLTLKSEFAFTTSSSKFWMVPLHWISGCLSRLPTSLVEFNMLQMFFARYLKECGKMSRQM